MIWLKRSLYCVFEKILSLFKSVPSLLKEVPLTPRLEEEHRKAVLFRTKVACWIAAPLYPFTILGYNYFAYPEVLNKSWIAFLPAQMGLMLILASLRTRFFQRHYHLPMLFHIGIFTNYAQVVNLQFTGGGGGLFFFPYFAVYIGMTIFYPAQLRWSVITAFTLVITYSLTELSVGRDIVSSVVLGNVIYLIDAAILAICGTQVFFRTFLREKKNQIELEEAYRKLQELDQLKNKFFANISHELRTPLTLILAPAESVIKKGEAWGVKHEAQKNVEVIRHNALRLLKLVNQLLDLSKIDAGKMELHLSSVQVAPFLKEIQDSVQPLADEKGLKLEFNAPEDLEAEFDRDHIEKVMLNLT